MRYFKSVGPDCLGGGPDSGCVFHKSQESIKIEWLQPLSILQGKIPGQISQTWFVLKLLAEVSYRCWAAILVICGNMAKRP